MELEKKYMKAGFTMILLLIVKLACAQCPNNVSPTSQMVSCDAGGSMVSFSCSAFNPSVSVRHEWYHPMHPISSGLPIYTSTSNVSNYSARLSPGVYSVVTTEVVSQCASTSTFIVGTTEAYPTFSVISSTNYTLGCAPINQTTVNIYNAQSTQSPAASCSYTFLAPTFSGMVTPSMVLGAIPYTITGQPGTWTLIVQDNDNLCRTMLAIPITENTTVPQFAANISTNTLTCNNPTALATANSTNANVTFKWLVPSFTAAINNPTVEVGPITGPPTGTASLFYGTYTLVAKYSVNACESTSYIATYQNFHEPVSAPVIAAGSPTASDCLNPVILSIGNSSTTSGAGAASYIINPCWFSVAQPSVCGTNTSSVLSPGWYHLSVEDNYNGCSHTDSLYVPVSGGNAVNVSFMHNVGLNGGVQFSNTSVGTTSNASYFWNFGDGNTATTAAASHTYISSGAYPVSLRIANGNLCSVSTKTQYINVTGLTCLSSSAFEIVPTQTAQYWNIVPEYPYNVIAAQWSWGDGAFSDNLYTSHSYSSGGSYNICLSVTVSCDGASTNCVSYYLSKSAEANMGVHVNVVAPPLVNVKDHEAEDFLCSVYPNPSQGILNLKINFPNRPLPLLEYELLDLLGKVVYTQQSDVSRIASGFIETNLYLEKVANGCYYLKVKAGELQQVLKIIIHR
jgi:PKD repeat protein